MFKRAQKRDPLVVALGLGDEILKIANDVILLIGLTVGLVVWVLLIGLASAFSLSYLIGVLWIFGLILLVLSPVIIFKGVVTTRRFSDWVEDFLPFSYILKFETFPSAGKTPEERILNKLMSVYLDVGSMIKKRPELVKLNSKVQGRESEHHFDVYVNIPKWDRDIFVRRFDKPGAVTKDDITRLQKEVLDVVKKSGHFVLDITVVSTGSFERGSVDYVKTEEGGVDGIGINLVLEKPHGYEVVCAGE
jgi:hypothetical protein